MVADGHAVLPVVVDGDVPGPRDLHRGARLQLPRRQPPRRVRPAHAALRQLGRPMSLLEVDGLRVRLPAAGGLLTVVDGVDYRVEQGEVFGVAGESGSGKTMSMLALLGRAARRSRGRGARELRRPRPARASPPHGVRELAGRDLAMVFQDPMTSLHPMLTIGRQLTEHVRLHLGFDRRAAEQPCARAARAGAHPGPGARPFAPTRTSSRAGCASGSRSRSPSPAARSC